MSTKVEKWVAADGSLHDTEEAADNHDALMSLISYIDEEFSIISDTAKVVQVLEEKGWVVTNKGKE